MIKYGGIRKSLVDTDFKYIEYPTRIIWLKSVIQNAQKIVDFVATIPYNTFRYEGDIYFEITKSKPVDIPDEEQETKFSIENVDIVEIPEEHDSYRRMNIGEILQNEMNEREKKRLRENLISYNFFGGTVYELLNDRYTNVNLHKYVDPTSDIDIKLLTNYNIINYLMKKMNLVEKKDGYYFTSNYTLIYQDENGILRINPYLENISNFLYNYLSDNLNTLNLQFDNSVPFIDDEYHTIEEHVRNIDLGYRSTEIPGTNARLISYFDGDFKTFRIQLVLKIQSGEHQIIDHFFEFLIGYYKYDSPHTSQISINNKIYNISSPSTLFLENLKAYKQRESLIIRNTIDTRHKGINHACRFIYLLDLIKNNDIFNDLWSHKSIHFATSDKTQCYTFIRKHIKDSYIIYYYISGKNIYKKIKTEYIVKAFQSVLKSMYNSPTTGIIASYLDKIDSTLTEERMYSMLSRFFDLNASPLRHFIMNSSQNINLLDFIDEMPIESYRERMRQLLISVDNASSEEEKNELQRQIEELEKEFQRNLPEMSVTSEYTFKGGKQHNKSKKKYKNKLRMRKHKNTKRRRRH